MSRPAWSLPAEDAGSIGLPVGLAGAADAASGRSGAPPGAACKVCILDSGVDPRPPARRRRSRAPSAWRSARTRRSASSPTSSETCAGTGRRAPASSARSPPTASCTASACSGAGATGSGDLILAGLRYAVEQGFDVINMSLSTTKKRFAETLHELADGAYFRRTVLVAAAHNMPVESFPWRFSSVISVGSHEEDDPVDLVREPVAAGRVLRARHRRRRRVAGRRHDPRHGQQLRGPAHRGARRARAREAPGADAVRSSRASST